MKKLQSLLVSALVCSSVWGASIGFEGSVRTEANFYNKLALSDAGVDNSKKYILSRMLLEPSIVVDDHFTVYSQWNLLSTLNPPGSPTTTLTPGVSTGIGTSQSGYIFGDQTAAGLVLSRAWLEWNFDFGVLLVGRMPFSWGYGVIWDSGGIWDDFQTTLDRLVYRIHLGNVTGAFAYTKPLKGSVLGNSNDQDFYMVFLEYDNPEMEMKFGAVYERQIRTPPQQAILSSSGGGPPNMPIIVGVPGLTTVPFPLNNHVLDLYIQKTMRRFTFGGEVSWITGDAIDYDGGGAADSLSAFAVFANITYEYHKFKAFLDFLYATGDDALGNGELSGFVLLHRNKRPGLILGRELLGTSFGPALQDSVGLGSLVAYGSGTTYSGVIYLVPGVTIEWAQGWTTGVEVIWARKAAEVAGMSKALGLEIDVATDYRVYKNAVLGLAFGVLIPGDGLGVTGPQGPFAIRGTLGLEF